MEDTLIKKRREQRQIFLRALYGLVDGRVDLPIQLLQYGPLASQLGLSESDTARVIEVLLGSECLVRLPTTGALALTHKGVLELESASPPDVNEHSEREIQLTPEPIVGIKAAAHLPKILFVDTEPETVKFFKERDYPVFEADMGFKSGKKKFIHPPHEVDLIVCDLLTPACFDSFSWGPGKNDNYQAKLVPIEQVNNVFTEQNGKRRYRYTVVHESQLPKYSSIFSSRDVLRAIGEAGVPFLLFLNQEWVRRITEFPNWFGLRWSFNSTAATTFQINEPLNRLLPELETKKLKFKLALQHAIESGPSPRVTGGRLPYPIEPTSLITNSVNDVFAQVVKVGKGSIWLIPGTHDNAKVIELIASRLEAVKETFASSKVTSNLVRRADYAIPTTDTKENDALIDVFISHSSADAKIAEALIELLKSALPDLHPTRIRCSSVAGYKLEGGTNTDDQLRKEMRTSPVFIGLLTRQSLQSTYVLFELGGRWGAGSQFTPLVAAGLRMSDLRPPLAGLHAHSADLDTDLQQMLEEISTKLSLKKVSPAIYDAQLKRLVAVSKEFASTSRETKLSSKPKLKQVGDVYYYYFEGEDVPYCSVCYGAKEQLVPLGKGESFLGGFRRHCLNCKNFFYEKPASHENKGGSTPTSQWS